MRRWGQLPDYKPDSWYAETAKIVYRPDIDALTAQALIAEGRMKPADFLDFKMESGYKPPQKEFIDNVTYDGRTPNAYLDKLKIGLKGKDKL